MNMEVIVGEEKTLRTEINSIVNAIKAESIEFRDTRDVWSHIKKQFGKSQQECDVPELMERKKFAEEMLATAKAEREARKNWWPKHTPTPAFPFTPLVKEAKTFVWPERTDF